MKIMNLKSFAFVSLFCAAPLLGAACTIDFEDLNLNTAVTNQYQGVTFSVEPGYWEGHPLFMRIKQPSIGTTSSGTKCLRIDPGAGFSSVEYLVMVFDLPQNHVSFTLGDQGGNFAIRSYTATSGGTPINTTTVATVDGVRTVVTVTDANVRRIEVESDTRGAFEAIDDLTFEADATPPIAEITSPAFGECVCADQIVVRGRACDDIRGYGSDMLEYKPVSGGDWTYINSYTSPSCEHGSWLYSWSTAAVPEGTYYLRLTVTNKCGLSSEAITVVTVDRSIEADEIRRPIPHTILGGTVCIDGSANDRCFSHYKVEYRAETSGGSFLPVDPANPVYTAQVYNDPLAAWNTANNATPDGDYTLVLTTFDHCDHAQSHLIGVTVDNTAPVGVISSPIQCSKRAGIIPVYGTASDAHLSGWVLQYSDVNTHGWTDIASGTSPVFNGLLANWDTTSLPACAYALRLVVTDQSKVNMDCSGSAGANQTVYMLTLDVVKSQLEEDTDGDGMPDIWERAHGLNPDDPSDAALDSDHDGATNLAEFLAGTDPRDPNSNLRITAIAHEASDTTVTWNSTAGHHYVVEETASLDSANFSTVSPLISVPSDGSTTFVHQGATGPSGFYRVKLVK